MQDPKLTDTIETEHNYRNTLHVKGARVNNLKDIEVILPKNKLIVVSGVSGSGKSSISIDTIYAEGQRRYVESLSSYARQFLNRMKKPDMDFIKGICPAIAVEQKVSTSNARSTVGSLTEVYDLLRLLYARLGKTISPVSGLEVKKHTVTDVVNFILNYEPGVRIRLMIPLQNRYPDRLLSHELSLLMQKGYTRLYVGDELKYIESFLEEENPLLQKPLGQLQKEPIYILIDRLVTGDDSESVRKQIADSVQTAFDESFGNCLVADDKGIKAFNNRFEADGIEFLDPSPALFNYNNPYGACPECEGYGRVIGIDADKVIPDKTLSVHEGAVLAWKGESASLWQDRFIQKAIQLDFPIHRPYEFLTEKEQDLLWNGDNGIQGINDYFRELEEKTYKIQNRVILARYRGKTKCPSCKGSRLRKEALYVYVADNTIDKLVLLPIEDMLTFFEQIQLSDSDKKIAERILTEIISRLNVMCQIGLNYLHLDRLSSTLSGGEIQRINLTRTLGSNLASSLYVLDEPSIGLHPRDTLKLVEVLKKLRDLGNTVLVVEHEEDVIRQADFLLDMGPDAGIHGGEVVFAGNFKTADPDKHLRSLTVQYLHRRMIIPTPVVRRPIRNKIQLHQARMHNLKNLSVSIPLNALTVISGVSGSGKSTLVKEVLIPLVKAALADPLSHSPSLTDFISGDLKKIHHIEMIGQSPIGRSSRSNPITYVKAFDHIRDLYTRQQLSKLKGYKPKHFSFNVEGGRCETCKGDGEIVVEMQFLPDVTLTCEECNGKRFRDEILEVKYKEKNINDILNMSIDEALEFFKDLRDIVQKIKPLSDVGLGYVKLGQSSSTLSGGEAQRVKLASYLGMQESRDKILFVFDEPTTGLHFHDVLKLLSALQSLIELGHTVVVVEHHLDMIKSADWVIDLGPEAGLKGGYLVYMGTPDGIIDVEESFTGNYLRDKWKEEGFVKK